MPSADLVQIERGSLPPEALLQSHSPKQFLVVKLWMEKQMRQLLHQGGPRGLAFPHQLSSASRKCGHQVAGKLKLSHSSTGDDSHRTLEVGQAKEDTPAQN